MPKRADSSDFLAGLLHALAESLDVREIFARISEAAARAVPHDFLMLGVWSEDRQRVRLMALSGDLPGIPGDVPVPEAMRRALMEHESIVTNDLVLKPGGTVFRCLMRVDGETTGRPVEVAAEPLWKELATRRGIRSFLRIAIRLRGGVFGGVLFCSTAPDAYPPEQVARARQIADCVALALAHQRLAEEEQRSAEARARAARLEQRVRWLTEELEAHGRHRVVGRSAAWRDVLEQAGKVAGAEATVLLTGESGTGKEVVARFIHRASARAEGPFVAINCAALPEQLLESELFGHEKGAFTGAMTARAGTVEQAAGGVLFLDEVGEMSPAVQAKFLRVLQEREYQRLGGTRTMKADVRVLAATNRDLKSAVARGSFREDLYYRLAVFELGLPALRERPEDLPLLAEAFLEEIGRDVGRPAAGLAPEARAILAAHAWPGNVRELRNALERAVILCEGGMITPRHLPIGLTSPSASAAPAAGASASLADPGPGTLEAAERDMILKALARAGNNKSKAARLLGLTRAQLRSRIDRHGITAED